MISAPKDTIKNISRLVSKLLTKLTHPIVTHDMGFSLPLSVRFCPVWCWCFYLQCLPSARMLRKIQLRNTNKWIKYQIYNFFYISLVLVLLEYAYSVRNYLNISEKTSFKITPTHSAPWLGEYISCNVHVWGCLCLSVPQQPGASKIPIIHLNLVLHISEAPTPLKSATRFLNHFQ